MTGSLASIISGIIISDKEMDTMFKIIVDTDVAQAVINKNIYGHFSEHLGRCIYEGIWVGEDSVIPNTRGIRNDCLLYTSDAADE